VLTSEGNLRAYLEIRNIRVSQQTYLLVDVTLLHDFIGADQIGQTQDQLHNPDHPDHILERASANKIRNYRDTHHRKIRHVAFLPACMSTSGRTHGELVCLIFFLSNKQTDYYFAALGYQPHKKEFCHSRVFFFQNTGKKTPPELTQVQPLAQLDGVCPWPSLPDNGTHGPHPAWRYCKRGPTVM
jgi:hypothetical protein